MKLSLRLARVVSRVFDPIVEIPVILTGVVGGALVNGWRWRFLTLLLFIDAVLPAVLFSYLVKTGQAGGWDFPKLRARRLLFTFALMCNLAGVGLGYILNRQPLAQILLTFWILGVIYVGITWWWKISVHMGVNATLATVAVEFLGGQWGWLYLIPVVVGWARIKTKQHDWIQVITGGVIPVILVPLLFSWLRVK